VSEGGEEQGRKETRESKERRKAAIEASAKWYA